MRQEPRLTEQERRIATARSGKTDGRVFPVTEVDLVRGAVLRMAREGVWSTYSDCLVVDVRTVKDGRSEPTVLLARPYAYVSCSETTSPGVLTGVEQFEVPVSRLLAEGSSFSAVVQSTGLVATYIT